MYGSYKTSTWPTRSQIERLEEWKPLAAWGVKRPCNRARSEERTHTWYSQGNDEYYKCEGECSTDKVVGETVRRRRAVGNQTGKSEEGRGG